jgi:hypothetical protein
MKPNLLGHPKSKQYFPLHSVEDNRIYAYVRIETGDEMSKRAKFALITWIGPGVSPLKKAKVSTDKAFLKEACPVRVNNTICVKSMPIYVDILRA